MKSLPFGGFQAGILDDPSSDAEGGFEFASGMDIFTEPGVLKANFAMTPVSGFTPSAYGYAMDTTVISGVIYGYMSVGDKIYESTDGVTWSLFITNSNGTIYNLKIWNGYILYATDTKLGRCPVHNSAGKDDNWQTIDSAAWHPMMQQGGTMKIGAGRYIASIDESFTITTQAMKAPVGYTLMTFAKYQKRLKIGATLGLGVGTISTEDATTFDWGGTVLSSGSALPDDEYPLFKRGMNLLLTTGQGLFGFPDRRGEIYIFDGIKFVPFRQLSVIANHSDLRVIPLSGCEHLDTVLFGGDSTYFPGIFQMKGNVIHQPFVPSVISPGATEEIDFGFVGSAFNGKVLFSYYRPADTSYHVEYLGSNRQNNATVRTVWHRARIGRRYVTDQTKRWGGIKLNLKSLASGCSVKVEYRTDRNASFTDPGITIDSTNQNRAALFSSHPRSREIQFRLTYTTSGANTPELLSYDYLFEVLNNNRS